MKSNYLDSRDKVLGLLGTKQDNVVIHIDRDASFFRAYKGDETKDFKTRSDAEKWLRGKTG